MGELTERDEDIIRVPDIHKIKRSGAMLFNGQKKSLTTNAKLSRMCSKREEKDSSKV